MEVIQYKFNSNDIRIPEEYSFMRSHLDGIEFYIQLTEDGLNEVLYKGKDLDSICDIGFYSYYKMNEFDYWIDMLKDIVVTDTFTDEEYEKYISFMGIFEDECVRKFEEFEKSIVQNKE